MATVNQQIDALLKRRGNPAPGNDAGVFTNLDAPKNARTRFFAHARDEWALSHGFPYRLRSAHVDVGAPVKFSKTRAYVAVDEGADGKPVVETWRISGLQFWGDNPAKKSAGKPRTAARSVVLVAAKNPMLPEKKSKLPANFPYGVETKATENWGLQAAFLTKAPAVEYAHALAARYPRLPVRVIHYTGGPMK